MLYAGEFCDEQVFADGKVNHIGQIVGVIVAESKPLAQQAAKSVKISYDNLPSIITIEVSIEFAIGIFPHPQATPNFSMLHEKRERA